MTNKYDYVIVGAGIAGCSLAHFLSKYSKSVLLIDKNEDVAFGASGAAGAFLSPLLGKPNEFKDLITKALKFSVSYYKENFPDEINNCGTSRIPKNDEDKRKFNSYKDYMDFEYKEFEEGFLFDIGSVVDSYEVCKKLAFNTEKKFNYEVFDMDYKENQWFINNDIVCKNLFLTTGADISLIDEEYINIKAVWGQRIEVLTTSKIDINYHKECSLSISKNMGKNNKNLVSIGASHNRFTEDMSNSSYNLKLKNINKIVHNDKTKKIMNIDSTSLIQKANDIKKLEDVELFDVKIGARASSSDYFPVLGKLVDSKKSIDKFPHIINGTHIKDDMLETIDNLYVLNGVGGRGFVLSLYLANQLVENIINKTSIDKNIQSHRFFKRWAKKIKNK